MLLCVENKGRKAVYDGIRVHMETISHPRGVKEVCIKTNQQEWIVYCYIYKSRDQAELVAQVEEAVRHKVNLINESIYQSVWMDRKFTSINFDDLNKKIEEIQRGRQDKCSSTN